MYSNINQLENKQLICARKECINFPAVGAALFWEDSAAANYELDYFERSGKLHFTAGRWNGDLLATGILVPTGMSRGQSSARQVDPHGHCFLRQNWRHKKCVAPK